MMIATITSGLRQTLLAAATTAAPRECCGLLLGTPDRILAAVPARNVAAQPETSFEIDPATLLRTHREARGSGQQVIGHYHSHPDDSPQPSRRDAARAVEDGQLWLIIAAGSVSAWRAGAGDPDGNALHGRFLPVTLAIA